MDEQVLLAQRHGGVSRYVVALVQALRADPGLGVDVDLWAAFSANEHAGAAGLTRTLPGLAGDAATTLAGLAAYHAANTAARSSRRRAAVVHATWYHPRFLPALRRGAPLVTTVHDMTPELAPEQFPQRSPSLAKAAYVAASSVVLTVSQRSADDLVAVYGPPPGPVIVTPLAPAPVFSPRATPPPGAPGRYLLAVGARGGYKDFPTALDTLAALDRGVMLVAVGGGPLTQEERTAVHRRGLDGRVRAVRADDPELAAWYSHAVALLVTSRHEGFGLPTLEAMACGCPVVAADTSVHPEVGGPAADYAPAGDAGAFAAAVARLLDDHDHRARRRSAGLARAASFSWARTAAATAQGYRVALRS